MHGDLATLLGVLAAAALVVGFAFLGGALVRAARRGKKGVRGFGAALMLFGWGHMRDPRNDVVAQANEGETRRSARAADDREPPRSGL